MTLINLNTIKTKARLSLLAMPLAIALTIPVANANVVNTTSTIPQTNTNTTNQINSQQPVSVYFLNGIFNTDTQAQTSAIALFNRLKDNPQFLQLVENQQVHLRTLYNPTDPFIGDISELSAQASIQKTALDATNARIKAENLAQKYDATDLETLRQAIFNQEIYKANQAYQAQSYSIFNFIHKAGNRAIGHYQKLAKEVKRSLLAGEKVVIVAHSQGNYVIQGIYAQLQHDPQVATTLANNLSVVGVANVAATTPSGRYTTNNDDKAVYTWHSLQGGLPMKANFNAIFANGETLGGFWESRVQRQNDPQNHGFIETYLSARFDKDQQFISHSPEIVEKVEEDSNNNSQSKPSIYGRIVQQVMAGLKDILA